jgi:hypothetical protein
MRESNVKTIAVPQIPAPVIDASVGSPVTAALICDATQGPTRVVVRNISLGIDVNLAYSQDALLTLPSDGTTYILPAGFADEFLVMPGQKFYCAANAVNARVTVAISPWIGPSTNQLA